jgi:amidase
MARRVEDLILLLPLLVGPDGIDPAIVPMPLGDPRAAKIERLRVAFYPTTDLAPASDSIQEAVREAARALADAGATVYEIEAAGFGDAFAVGRGLMRWDGGAARVRLLRSAGTTSSRHFDNRPEGLSALDLDTLVTRWYDVRSRIATAYRDLDVILSPVNARTTPPSRWASEPDSMKAFSHTILHNVTGWPSGVVRCGTDADGLPVGVQITAHPAREDLVLAVALHLETCLGGFRPPAESRW